MKFIAFIRSLIFWLVLVCSMLVSALFLFLNNSGDHTGLALSALQALVSFCH